MKELKQPKDKRYLLINSNNKQEDLRGLKRLL